jgi:hypothetical protein
VFVSRLVVVRGLRPGAWKYRNGGGLYCNECPYSLQVAFGINIFFLCVLENVSFYFFSLSMIWIQSLSILVSLEETQHSESRVYRTLPRDCDETLIALIQRPEQLAPPVCHLRSATELCSPNSIADSQQLLFRRCLWFEHLPEHRLF